MSAVSFWTEDNDDGRNPTWQHREEYSFIMTAYPLVMPGPAWPPDMLVDDEQCWCCQRYKMTLRGTNANIIHPTCGHLDLRRADNLHSKLWPLASGSSFGDMSGIFHNTETSRAKLVPEDQIVKPRSAMHADHKSGFQANITAA